MVAYIVVIGMVYYLLMGSPSLLLSCGIWKSGLSEFFLSLILFFFCFFAPFNNGNNDEILIVIRDIGDTISQRYWHMIYKKRFRFLGHSPT